MAVPARHSLTLARTVALIRSFRVEQSDPDSFYEQLAADSVALVSRWARLEDAVVVDVGSGPGYFANAFEKAGARYVSCDNAADEAPAWNPTRPGTVATATATAVVGDGRAMPFRDGAFDVCFSSNVLEHVADPELLYREAIRVTAPDGLAFLAFTNWLGPLGGHETSPWHYLGGAYAVRRYQRVHGRPPMNRYRASLFPLSIGKVLRWVRDAEEAGEIRVLAVFPRYHPWWAHWVSRVPGMREFLTANCVIVLRRLS